eukprot:TRINITY_DN11533_c0_g1_i1.p1 TRINITY_DN11533_c0_g1~~TRINITY_DN11533_c0_g1_i1.p1  ORF type:complete len:389 (+),score=151.22 TRINITY_DN11533_c0_g1_i1:26-1168(+)
MQAQLLNQKLKSVPASEINDRSASMKVAALEEHQITAYQDTVQEANAEEWIELLGKDATPETQFVPISVEQAQELLEVSELVQKGQDLEEAKKKIQSSTLLSSMFKSLQDSIEALSSAQEPSVFVKTSSRSYKDSTVAQKTFLEMFKKFTRELSQQMQVSTQEENLRIIALLIAGTELLKVNNVQEVVERFLPSERMVQDLTLALDRKEKGWCENFVIRRWVPFDPRLEFRAFVLEGKLVALSQYNHLAYLEEVLSLKSEILARIMDFFESDVKSQLGAKMSRYIVDFGFERNDTSNSVNPEVKLESSPDKYQGILGRLWVIEINPYLPTTDSCLFSWERDQEHVQGKKDLDFRIRDKPTKGVRLMLSLDWRAALETRFD